MLNKKRLNTGEYGHVVNKTMLSEMLTACETSCDVLQSTKQELMAVDNADYNSIKSCLRTDPIEYVDSMLTKTVRALQYLCELRETVYRSTPAEARAIVNKPCKLCNLVSQASYRLSIAMRDTALEAVGPRTVNATQAAALAFM